MWRQSIKHPPTKRRREPLGAKPRAAASRALARNQNTTCSVVEIQKIAPRRNIFLAVPVYLVQGRH